MLSSSWRARGKVHGSAPTNMESVSIVARVDDDSVRVVRSHRIHARRSARSTTVIFGVEVSRAVRVIVSIPCGPKSMSNFYSSFTLVA